MSDNMNNNSLKIYIAAPYSAETEEERTRNVQVAIDAAFVLFHKGHFPYIPHLTHWVDKRVKETKVAMEWKDYMKWHKSWLETCDAFLYLNGSKGADLELQIAKDLGKTIFYSIDEILLAKNNEVVKSIESR